MKLNLNKNILDLEGKEVSEKVKDSDGNIVDRKISIDQLIVSSLMNTYQDDDKSSGEDKLTRFDLALKIKNSKGDIELSTEDITFIKKYTKKGLLSPLAFARTNEALEGK